MNILDEITVDFDLDSKILCETPAKLKLRDKTLKGIYFNLNDENTEIPALMLAKKKKKKKDDKKIEEAKKETKKKVKEEKEEVIVPEIVEDNEYADVNISEMEFAEAGDTFEETRKLRVSQEKVEIFSEVGQELVDMIAAAANLGYTEEPVVEEEPVAEVEVTEEVEPVVSEENEDMNIIETYSAEEMPEVEVTEEPVEEQEVQVENKEVEPVEEVVEEQEINLENVEEQPEAEIPEVEEVEVAIEEPEFNIEQGEEGIVATVEDVEVPVVEEETVTDEVPNVEEENTEETALDKASTFEIFNRANQLMQEIAELKNREKERMGVLAEKRELYQNTVTEAEELDKTYAERKQQAEELEKQFYDAVERQKNFYTDMKKGLEEKSVETEQEIEDYNNRTAVLQEENDFRLEQIHEEDEKIVRFQSLIDSVNELDNTYEEEYVKTKAA